jgi:hypothetical protein
MAKVHPDDRPQVVTYDLACPYCGTHTFTISPSILTYVPDEIRHLVFRNVMCAECHATFSEAVMTDPGRNRAQQAMYVAANAAVPAQATAV